MARKPRSASIAWNRVNSFASARAQLLAAEPDRLGVGYRFLQRQAREAHEAQAVAQLVLSLVVGQRVEGLQHEEAEHQHRIPGRAPTAAAVGARQYRPQLRAERL